MATGPRIATLVLAPPSRAGHIQAILRFPDCVDPNKITDHTYATAHGGYCPSNMKHMPSLRFLIRYDTLHAIPQGWSGVPPFKLACEG